VLSWRQDVSTPRLSEMTSCAAKSASIDKHGADVRSYSVGAVATALRVISGFGKIRHRGESLAHPSFCDA
jgi:hypothetical protein